MSPRIVCALEKFGECKKSFRQYRPWQRCCCREHTKRLAYLLEKKERSARRVRMNRKRAAGSPEPPWEAPKRVRCRRYIEVGFTRKALMMISEDKLDFFPGLEGLIPRTKQVVN